MIVHKPIVALVVVVSLMLTGIATAEELAKKPPAPAATAAPGTGAPVSAEYKIGIDDALDISVWNNTTMSWTVPIRQRLRQAREGRDHAARRDREAHPGQQQQDRRRHRGRAVNLAALSTRADRIRRRWRLRLARTGS